MSAFWILDFGFGIGRLVPSLRASLPGCSKRGDQVPGEGLSQPATSRVALDGVGGQAGLNHPRDRRRDGIFFALRIRRRVTA